MSDLWLNEGDPALFSAAYDAELPRDELRDFERVLQANPDLAQHYRELCSPSERRPQNDTTGTNKLDKCPEISARARIAPALSLRLR